MKPIYIYIIVSLFFIEVKAQQMPEAYFRLCAAVEQNNRNNALQWADSCLKLKPQRLQYQTVAGMAYFINQQYTKAIAIFSKVEKSRKGNGSLWLAKCYYAQGDTTSCFEWLRKHLESPQHTKESEILLDPVLCKLQNTPSWKNLWKTEWYSPLDRTIAEAEYLNHNGNYEQTIDLLNQHIKGEKSRASLYELRGDALLALGNPQAAANDYRIALRKSHNSPIYLAKIAQTLSNRNLYQPALKKINEAIAKAGPNPSMCLIRAQILHKRCMYQEALSDYKYYLSFYPNAHNVTEQLAHCATETGNYVDALLCLAKLIKLNPNNEQLRYLRGITLIRTEQPRNAIPDFDFAIQHNYMVAESYYHKALALIAIGNTNEACQCLSISIQYGCFKAQELKYKNCK